MWWSWPSGCPARSACPAASPSRPHPLHTCTASSRQRRRRRKAAASQPAPLSSAPPSLARWEQEGQCKGRWMDGWMEAVEAYGSPGVYRRPPTPAMGSTAGGGLIAPFHWTKMVAFFSIYRGDARGMCSSMGPTQLTQAPFHMLSHFSQAPCPALPCRRCPAPPPCSPIWA